MPYKPRTTDEVYSSLRDSLVNRIEKLSNFTNRSFNYVWTRAFARELRQTEVRALSSELSGLIDYVGGPITDDDLERLGIGDDVSADEVNEYMLDEYLDEYIKIVGVTRFEGQRATGTVQIDTQTQLTEVPAGTRVTTAPDSSGETIEFETTESVEVANGVTRVEDIPIQAVDVGQEYNLPENKIVRFAEPPIGVKGVRNTVPTDGGEGRESNEELRERAKQSVRASSEGGTADGIRGYLRQNVDGVGEGDVIFDEYPAADMSHVDVIVDGGLDQAVRDAIEFSRPTGIKHNLVRPQVIDIGMNVETSGGVGKETLVEDAIQEYYAGLGISENLYRDRLTKTILDVSDGIENVTQFGGYIDRVRNETFEYDSTQSEYRLDFTVEETNGSTTVTDSTGNEYIAGTDYTIEDQTGDGWGETLVWTGTTPDDEERFSVAYDVTVPDQTAQEDYHDLSLVRDEAFTWNASVSDTRDYTSTKSIYELDEVPFENSLSIADASGNTYTKGTDYELVENNTAFPQSIDWSIGGSTPDDNEEFTVTYERKVYDPVYSIFSTPTGEIVDASGNTYVEDIDYTITSLGSGAGADVIEWTTQPGSLTDGEEFYLTYTNGGDRFFDTREKARGSTITVTSN